MAMTRRVEFVASEPKNQQRFEILYMAVLNGGVQPGQQRAAGIETLRREARLLDALDAASAPDQNPAAPRWNLDAPPRTVAQGASFMLLQPDYELLRKRIDSTLWLPKAAREVVDAVDWLSAAPELTEETQA